MHSFARGSDSFDQLTLGDRNVCFDSIISNICFAVHKYYSCLRGGWARIIKLAVLLDKDLEK